MTHSVIHTSRCWLRKSPLVDDVVPIQNYVLPYLVGEHSHVGETVSRLARFRVSDLSLQPLRRPSSTAR